ncbi:MAG TPA: response regulator, partial [Vicinamibacterales bacterium]|nr:response regulator [Vicinamibacterales bacterium]
PMRRPRIAAFERQGGMARSRDLGNPMAPVDYIVYVVDDDVRMREALRELFTSLAVPSATFGSASEYVAHPKRDVPACLLLDVELPDMNGLDFQRQVRDADHPPIVFITGHGDIPSSVRAMKNGAVDFLVKPFSREDLVAAIDAAVTRDRRARSERAERARLQQRYSLLTPRESQVLPLIVGGLLNKQAAAVLGISEVTLQIHRSRIMQKMAADSFAELVRMAGQLNIALERRKQQ